MVFLVEWSTCHAFCPTKIRSRGTNQRLSFRCTTIPHWPKSRWHRAASNNDEEDDDDDDDDDTLPAAATKAEAKSYNVLGTPLQPCCTNVRGTGIGTGFYRNGYCSTGDLDVGRHTVCVQVTQAFLDYSQSVGNDLSTPAPQWAFPGLQEGDQWCLCAQRWAQAYQSQQAVPQLVLQATHEKTLDYVPLELLLQHAVDRDEALEILQTLNDQRDQLEKLL